MMYNKIVLKAAKILLEALPSAEMYEKSYMHRDYIMHTLVTPCTDFLITASKDGDIKFWKKMLEGIEFVKHYHAHMQAITGIACTPDGQKICSISTDKSIKIYDVLTFDMINMFKINYTPLAVCWVPTSTQLLIAISDKDSGKIRLYKYEEKNVIVKELNIHCSPVSLMSFNSYAKCIISCDIEGVIEYWSVDNNNELPKKHINFEFKSETDLFSLMISKSIPTSLTISHNGKLFAITDKEGQIRIFKFKTGKIYRQYDESLKKIEEDQLNGKLKLDDIDFGKRQSLEKDYLKSDLAAPSNVVFDESDNIIIYPTLIGIKIVNILENKVMKILGKVENERFCSICLFQGIPKVNTQIKGEKSDDSNNHKIPQPDPTLFCCSFKKKRFYFFTKREPEEEEVNNNGENDENTEGRDVFNEKPTEDELQYMTMNSKEAVKYGNKAVIHTTYGDIEIELYPRKTPKTNENFCGLARKGYYDKVIFHRVIRNFMIQTGDPKGNGTGGESLWGGYFEDELRSDLTHDSFGVISMANCGPNTNGSQFFITTVPCPHLNGKHTVFGKLVKGDKVVRRIEGVKTDKNDKPIEDIEIVNIDIY